MPVARHSRRSKRAPETECMAVFRFDISSSEPVQSVAFAPNVTPTTFENQPSPSLSPSSPSHNKKKPKGHIPRPPNAFILFRSDFVKGKKVPTDVETDHSNLSKVVGHTWRIMPDEERAVWFEKAREEQEKHRKRHPDYCYVPTHKKSGAAKRKVRECGFRDEKRCRTIAELLTAGKQGEELKAALKEFDRHHVPEIVTRFDTPITMSTFRRSSSPPTDAPMRSKKTMASRRRSNSRELSSRPSSAPSASSSRQPSPSTTIDLEAYDVFSFESSPSPTEPESIIYSIPVTDPSFNFDTFAFEAPASTSHYSPCSPSDGDFDGSFDLFSQGSQMSYSSQSEYDLMYHSVDTASLDPWTASTPPLSSTPSTPHSFIGSQASDHLPELEYLPPQAHVFGAPMGFVPHDTSLSDGACQFATPNDVDVFGTSEYGYNYGPEAPLSYQIPTSNALAGDFGFIQPAYAI